MEEEGEVPPSDGERQPLLPSPARGDPEVGSQVEFRSPLVQGLSRLGHGTLRHLGSSANAAKSFVKVYGPGLVVMLADVDAGSILTAADSGRAYGYSLCWVNLLFVLPLYMAQELTVRVGAVTGCGFLQLLRRKYGRVFAHVTAILMAVSSIGAMASEFGGIIGVAQVGGLSPSACAVGTALLLLCVTVSASHHVFEHIALCFGLCLTMFFVTAWLTLPSVDVMVHDKWPLESAGWRRLVAANLGAVVMPWMLTYQMSSIAEKDLCYKDISSSRKETFVGAIISQTLMAAIASTGASLPAGVSRAEGAGFNDVPSLAHALGQSLGPSGIFLGCLGMMGGALTGSMVAGMSAVWSMGEARGDGRLLVCEPKAMTPPGKELKKQHGYDTSYGGREKWYVAFYAFLVGTGTVISLAETNGVLLSVAVQVMNCLFAPFLLWLLFSLASTLPDERVPGDRYRLMGCEQVVYAVVFGITTVVSVTMPLIGDV